MNKLLELFLLFFKIGIFTFGGGQAMIPMITEEVIAHDWMSTSKLTQLIAVSESTPGPFAINIATFIGSSQAGFFGSLLATLGVITPSFIIILLLASILSTFSKNKMFKRIISGVNPVIIGLIFAAGLWILYGNIFTINSQTISIDYVQILLFIGLLTLNLTVGKKIHPIILIVIAGGLGALIYQFYTPSVITFS